MSAALKLNPETENLSRKPLLGEKRPRPRLVWENLKLSAGTHKKKPKAKPDASYGRVLYNYFRYYDPSTGRYITSDPIGLAGGLNTYLYANANPINEIDPQGLSSFFFARPPVTPRPLLPRPPAPRPFPGNDPAKPPGPGWVWQGKPGSQPGGKEGNWYNPNTGESLRPDLSHPKPIGRHWDWKDHNGKWWRIFPDGSAEPKILPPVSPGNCPDKNNREWEECFSSGWCT